MFILRAHCFIYLFVDWNFTTSRGKPSVLLKCSFVLHFVCVCSFCVMISHFSTKGFFGQEMTSQHWQSSNTNSCFLHTFKMWMSLFWLKKMRLLYHSPGILYILNQIKVWRRLQKRKLHHRPPVSYCPIVCERFHMNACIFTICNNLATANLRCLSNKNDSFSSL